mmetsp:Transcript_19581/g.29745  ORF Transcript_19581/g.29745 Transcript_19581/m.29745 type:complete len:284 (-) Transcript_19581:2354-3205(-)
MHIWIFLCTSSFNYAAATDLIAFAHHKTGWFLAHNFVNALKVQGYNVTMGGNWFGQPLAPDFEKMAEFKNFFCATCYYGDLSPVQPVVNFVRDPFEMVVSGYLYHVRGAEIGFMKFGKLGMRGGDLRPFLWPSEYGLPSAIANNKEWTDFSYPEYLKKLKPTEGILAESIRVMQWELWEVVSSVRTTRKYKSMHSVCLEDYFLDIHDAIRRLLLKLQLPLSLLGSLEEKMSTKSKNAKSHGTRSESNLDEEYRSFLLNMVRKYDTAYFKGTFARLSAEIGCVR